MQAARSIRGPAQSGPVDKARRIARPCKAAAATAKRRGASAASTTTAAAATTTTTTAPKPATEPAALASFVAAGPSTPERCVAVMREAARTRATPPEQVEGALALLESLQRQDPRSPPPPPAAVLGSVWHLVFSTASSLRAFQYIPVRELFRVGSERVALDSRVGPVRFVISGPVGGGGGGGAGASSSSSSHYDAATGALSFTFTDVEAFWSPFSGDAVIPAGDKPFWSTRVKAPKAKTYTFFFAEQSAAAAGAAAGSGGGGGSAGVGGVAGARSSGGGLALLVRV